MRYTALFLFLLLLTACEKEVQFDMGQADEKLVVEGTIETDAPPYVLLTRSIGFFSRVDLNTLNEAFVHDAEIIVSDGSDSVILKEYQLEAQGVSVYFYSVDTAQAGASAFKGQVGKSYQLSIRVDGKSYTSSTRILPPNPLDSIWSIPMSQEAAAENPNGRWLMARYTDPPEVGNAARYFTRINNSAFSAPRFSVNDDVLVNGTSFELQLQSGLTDAEGEPVPFNLGDTVVVKWCAIDRAVFDFWRTLEFSYASIGNPFSTPVEISTNIEGGALGVWAGYSPSYHTLVVHDSL